METYVVTGIEQEAGVLTQEPIEASDREAALAEARRRGIRPTSVKRVGDRPAMRMHSVTNSHEIPAHELIEKTSRTVRPRVLTGWVLLLMVLPASVALLSFIGSALELGPALLGSIILLFSICILYIATQCFSRFWP